MRTERKRRRDAQRAFPRALCGRCGGELYAGMTYWRVWGRTLCGECAAAELTEKLAGCRQWREEVGR